MKIKDCLLSESQLFTITEKDACYNFLEVAKATAKAQLESPDLKAYIDKRIDEATEKERLRIPLIPLIEAGIKAERVATLEDMKSMELIKNHNHKKGEIKLVSCARCSFNALLERALEEASKPTA